MAFLRDCEISAREVLLKKTEQFLKLPSCMVAVFDKSLRTENSLFVESLFSVQKQLVIIKISFFGNLPCSYLQLIQLERKDSLYFVDKENFDISQTGKQRTLGSEAINS